MASSAQAATETKIFEAHPDGAALAKLQAARPADLPARGAFPVKVNMAQLKALPIQGEATLNLPDGRSITIVHDHNRVSESGRYTFVGYVRDRGNDHRVILTEAPNGLANGVLNLPDGELRVEGRTGGAWLVDAKKAGITYAPLAEPLMPKVLSTAAAKRAQAQAGDLAVAAQTTVDLMIVYAPNMVSMYGGDAGARARIDNQMAIFNQILTDSDVQVTARLVKALPTSQSDNVNQGTLLEMITNGQGAFSNVPGERDASKADLVHLLHKPTVGVGSCGIAYLSVTQGPTGHDAWGYGVTDDNCPNMVMAHEVGHNFGMNHDHAQGGGDPVYPYAWGYIVPGTNYGDVMSYAGEHYYKYSNPRIGGCSGQACGQNDWADAARAINGTKDIVAAYRKGNNGSTDKVCFYGDVNYAGGESCVGVGSGSMPAGFNDNISSVTVPPGFKVELFENTGFGGRTLALTTNEPNLVGRNFNDITSSYKVTKEGICFFVDANYTGASKCVSTGANFTGADFNDNISSVRMPPGYKVKLFEHADYLGRKLVLTADNPFLGNNTFNDITSSYKIKKIK